MSEHLHFLFELGLILIIHLWADCLKLVLDRSTLSVTSEGFKRRRRLLDRIELASICKVTGVLRPG